MDTIFNVPEVIQSKINLDEFNLRQKIELMEWFLLKTTENEELDVTEDLKDGYYIRALVIPKGFLAIGKIHLFQHIFMMSYGDIEVATDDWSKRLICDAAHPIVMIIPSNSKKIVYAHENTLLTCFEKAEGNDIDKIYNHLHADSDLSWVDTLMSECGIYEDNKMLKIKEGTE